MAIHPLNDGSIYFLIEATASLYSLGSLLAILDFFKVENQVF
jgi:hypothetical protein